MGRPRVRPRILQAAIRLFGRGRYETVTISDLAGEAGVSSSAINRYYGNKEALYVIALHSVIGNSLAHLAHFALDVCTDCAVVKPQSFIQSAIHSWYSSFSQDEARLLQHALMDPKRKPVANSPLEKIISLIVATVKKQTSTRAESDCTTSATSLIWSLFQLKVTHSDNQLDEMQQVQQFVADWLNNTALNRQAHQDSKY